jgi:glycosyltransferase involved in cell wall biosynthesis
MTQPRVSVILPTCNRLEYLRLAVESVLAQTFTAWELVIADDGSDEPTRAYLRQLESPPRIRVIWLEHSGYCSKVRNAALREARGELVAFIDSDDVWAPEKLQLQAAVTQQWSYTGYRLVDAKGDPISVANVSPWVPYEGDVSKQILADQAHVSTPSVMVRKRLLEEVGYFDEQLKLFEDYDLWLRLLTRSPVTVIDKPLVSIRKHAGNTCGSGAVMLDARARVLRKLRPLVRDRATKKALQRLRAVNAWQRLKWWFRVAAV